VADQIAVTAPVAVAPRKSRKLLMIAAFAAVAVAAGAAVTTGAVPFLGAPATAEEAPPAEGEVVDVALLTTNVGGGAGTYVRVGFAAVLQEGVTADQVGDRFALLKDAALTEVSKFDGASLATPAGQRSLRQALTARAHEIWPDGEVMRVVLTELLVQ
jgi:flagellar protein FliL